MTPATNISSSCASSTAVATAASAARYAEAAARTAPAVATSSPAAPVRPPGPATSSKPDRRSQPGGAAEDRPGHHVQVGGGRECPEPDLDGLAGHDDEDHRGLVQRVQADRHASRSAAHDEGVSGRGRGIGVPLTAALRARAGFSHGSPRHARQRGTERGHPEHLCAGLFDGPRVHGHHPCRRVEVGAAAAQHRNVLGHPAPEGVRRW